MIKSNTEKTSYIIFDQIVTSRNGYRRESTRNNCVGSSSTSSTYGGKIITYSVLSSKGLIASLPFREYPGACDIVCTSSSKDLQTTSDEICPNIKG